MHIYIYTYPHKSVHVFEYMRSPCSSHDYTTRFSLPKVETSHYSRLAVYNMSLYFCTMILTTVGLHRMTNVASDDKRSNG